MNEIVDIAWTDMPATTETTGTDWMVGCKCGCENEEECHGESGCDADEDIQND